MPDLAVRMASLLGCLPDEGDELDIDAILDKLWIYNQTYTIPHEVGKHVMSLTKYRLPRNSCRPGT